MPFYFEKLIVYQKAEIFALQISKIVTNIPNNNPLKDQILRASTSITLNIAEGAGRFSKPDKKHFYVISRGSIYECVSILRILNKQNHISNNTYIDLYSNLDSLSRLLSSLIQKMSKN